MLQLGEAPRTAEKRRFEALRRHLCRPATSELAPANIAARGPLTISADGRSSLHKLMQRKSTIAFLMTLPLILLILVLVAYPAGYAIYLAMLEQGHDEVRRPGEFHTPCSGRDTFWMSRSIWSLACLPSPR